jgi:hypothetical protein
MEDLKKELERQYVLLYEQKNFASKLIKYIFDKGLGIISNEKNKPIDNTTKTSISSNSNFRQITDKIIEKLEGGYYNPIWHKKSGMGKSGETLFGLDRKYGGTLNTSPEGREFWRLVDQNKNKEIWKHYYTPTGSLNEKLRNLLSSILQKSYQDFSKKYLNPESQKIVESDPRLKFHFAYATWNGQGFFRKFADRLNQRIENQRILDPTKLFKMSMQDRRDTVIASSAPKIEKIFNS